MSGGCYPFIFVRQDILQGFEIDVMNAVAEETGLNVEFVTMSFSGLIGASNRGHPPGFLNRRKINAPGTSSVKSHPTRPDTFLRIAWPRYGIIAAYSTEEGHLFHAIAGTHSTASRAAIPREGGQLV
jgi:hypothetical protein